jgi:hypothetical protein
MGRTDAPADLSRTVFCGSSVVEGFSEQPGVNEPQKTVPDR